MPELPPVTMKIQADATEFHATVEGVKKALASVRPTDYQIRLDALTLTVAMAAANGPYTPEQFAEWQQCFEESLREALA